MKKKKAPTGKKRSSKRVRKFPHLDGSSGRPVWAKRYYWAFAFISVPLLILSFPATNLDILVWVALMPWLLVLGETKIKVALGLSYLIGFLFFGIACAWLRYVTPWGWFLLSFYLAFFFAAAGLGAWLLKRHAPRGWIFIFPFMWVALEYLRAHLLTGFPWFFLGHTQYKRLALIQIADTFGVYGISFMVALANSSITQALAYYRQRQRAILRPWDADRRPSIIGLGMTFVLILSSLIYGQWRLSQMRLEPGPKIGIVQGNIPQRLKEEAIAGDELTAQGIFSKHLQLTFDLQGLGLDLILWPETMVPGILNKDVETQEFLGEMARSLEAALVVGAVTRMRKEEETYGHNSAYYFSKKGKIIKRYDKLHLVPFGEFVPLRRYFPWLGRLVPYPTNFRPGLEPTIFEAEKSHFSVAICFEDTFPYLIRKFRRGGADFLVNLTNDGWFRDSAELDQHMAFSVFRAVENRLALVRAANTGISCFVLPSGQILKVLEDPRGKRREVAGTLTGQIFTDPRKTFYSAHGDVFAACCSSLLIVFALGVVLRYLRKERRERQKRQ